MKKNSVDKAFLFSQRIKIDEIRDRSVESVRDVFAVVFVVGRDVGTYSALLC
jgi:hypothetical protein